MNSPSRKRSSNTSFQDSRTPDLHKDIDTASNGFFSLYRQSLKERPRITNAIVSMLISSTADVVAQTLERGHLGPIDRRRTLALALTAFTYNGFILTSWLIMLNGAIPGSSMGIVLKKLALTQTILQPFVYVPFFFFYHGLLIGQSFHDIVLRFTTDYFSLLLRLWSLFMPTRLLMFLIIPPPYQVLWDSSVSFFWQVALSLFDASRSNTPHDAGLVGKVAAMDQWGVADSNSYFAASDFTGKVIHQNGNVGN